MLTRIINAFGRVRAFLAGGDARLRELSDEVRQLRRAAESTAVRTKAIESRATAVEKAVAGAHRKEIAALRKSVARLEEAVQAGFAQANVQISRLSGGGTAAPRAADAPSMTGAPIPLTVSGPGPAWRRPDDGSPHPDPDGREWLRLDACPVCRCAARTVVLEWNKLVILETAPDDDSARYDYSVCHACGVLYAARRPVGRRFLYMLDHFGEVSGKQTTGAPFANPMLNPYPLSPEEEADLRRMATRGPLVSDHLGLSKRDYLPGLSKDRFENSVHVDVIGLLVEPRGARVLELRPRTGAIAESLRRLYGADVSVVPMWESQRILLKEVYGFESNGLVDYDRFTVPFEGRFDLVVCNHMLTHMLRPADFLRELHARLAPGGHVYFYNEPDDAEYLEGGQSMIAHLNPLHMHGFGHRSLVRMLAASGFEVVFVKRRDMSHLCLARAVAGAVPWEPMPETERNERIAALRRARNRAILKSPAAFRGRLAGAWREAVDGALAAGEVEFDAKGHLRFLSQKQRAQRAPVAAGEATGA